MACGAGTMRKGGLAAAYKGEVFYLDILVTGGAGYIGSHTCIALLAAGHSVIIADNFCNSSPDIIPLIERISGKRVPFYEVDVTNPAKIDELFFEHSIDGVVHFAGLKAVGESVREPLLYYRNNVIGTIVLAGACRKYGVDKFVFSSSATVYGDNSIPFAETMELRPAVNPYGETKVMSERILTDAAMSDRRSEVSLLRYFNPVGAHESGLIGESPSGIPNNLMPYITQVAKGRLDKLRIFGGDYPTPDGTGIRDYVHVMDLAEGHVAAMDNMRPGVNVYNLGTGRGTSVLELVAAFEEANGIRIPYEITPRRPGDIAVSYADASKAERELGWKASRSIVDMCRDAWRFEKNRV